MKTLFYGVLWCGIVLGAPVVFGGPPMSGVAGVEVTVKENSSKKFVTDSRGDFVLQNLKPGNYTLLFKAQKAKDSRTSTTSNSVTVAQSYAIKVEGTTHATNRSAVSDQLLAGVAVPVQVGANGAIRGQIAAGATQKMVWIAPEMGSHIPGHWVPANSPEAKGHTANTTYNVDRRDMQNMLDSHDPFHQEGFGGSGR